MVGWLSLGEEGEEEGDEGEVVHLERVGHRLGGFAPAGHHRCPCWLHLAARCWPGRWLPSEETGAMETGQMAIRYRILHGPYDLRSP